MNQAGSASAGPDLNLPMNPTEYLTDAGLRALIRDPRSVRVWPEQRMPGFAEEDLSDEELGLILAYLSHMAGRKSRATEGGGRACRKSHPDIFVMQSAENWAAKNTPCPLNSSRISPISRCAPLEVSSPRRSRAAADGLA
jgi:hypothetical protein